MTPNKLGARSGTGNLQPIGCSGLVGRDRGLHLLQEQRVPGRFRIRGIEPDWNLGPSVEIAVGILALSSVFTIHTYG